VNESKKVTTTIVSDELKEWYNKNKLLIKTLGLSHSEAYFQKARISKLAHDIGVFWYKMIWFWGITLLILLLLLASHLHFVQDGVKFFYLIAYYLGVLGSFLLSYGFLFYLRGLVPEKKSSHIFASMPQPPQRPQDFLRYSASLNKLLVDHGNTHADEKWQQVKVELRKQVSLAAGFILVAVSFMIQLVLQFF